MALLKSRSVSIDPADPWGDDPFDRGQHGNRLLALIRTLRDDPYVLAINGDWGTGKSVFLRRLEAQFEGAAPKIPFIRIDAWAADDAEDPLVPFVAALHNRVKQAQSATTKVRRGLIDAASQLAVPLAAFGANLVAPGAVSAIGAAAELGNALIEWELDRDTTTAKFKGALEEARDLLTRRRRSERISTPIVIAIDELDRCRPDFSIRALERIKHFFNVPGIIFLIATDRGNLPAAVKSVYGDSVDGDLYLRKFFDYEYRLPRPPASAHLAALWHDYQMDSALPLTLEDHLVLQAFRDGSKYGEFLDKHRSSLDAFEYRHFFVAFAEAFKLSLRDQSQAFTMLAAHVRTTPPNFVRLPVIDCLFVCLRFFHLPTFEAARAGALIWAIIPPELPQRVRNALASVNAMQDAKALTIYLQQNDRDEAMRALEQQINIVKNQQKFEEMVPLARMHDRIARSNLTSPKYIDTLLGLLYSFAPEEL